jgi:transcriptional regulator with XRE-family HTH domain
MSSRRTKSDARRELQALRRVLGMSQEKFAEAIGASPTAVKSWEQGWSTPMPRYRPAMAEALGIGLIELAHLLDPNAAPSMNGHGVPTWLSHYDSLVLAAGRLAVVELAVIPDLLQTKAYAAAVELAMEIPLSDHEVSERVERRAERQKVLYRDPEPLQLVAVLSEGVLLDRVGGPEVMATQLDHVADLAERPNVDVRIVGPGRAPSAINGFELLSRPGEADPFMAVAFSVDGPSYIDVAYRLTHLVARMNHLLDTALSASESADRIRDIREAHRR